MRFAAALFISAFVSITAWFIYDNQTDSTSRNSRIELLEQLRKESYQVDRDGITYTIFTGSIDSILNNEIIIAAEKHNIRTAIDSTSTDIRRNEKKITNWLSAFLNSAFGL